MAEIGKWLFIFGAGSAALNCFNMEFSLLMWIDAWGPSIGWAIRGALVVVGSALFFLGTRSSADASPDAFADIQSPAAT